MYESGNQEGSLNNRINRFLGFHLGPVVDLFFLHSCFPDYIEEHDCDVGAISIRDPVESSALLAAKAACAAVVGRSGNELASDQANDSDRFSGNERGCIKSRRDPSLRNSRLSAPRSVPRITDTGAAKVAGNWHRDC
jgi:hypothetical protein